MRTHESLSIRIRCVCILWESSPLLLGAGNIEMLAFVGSLNTVLVPKKLQVIGIGSAGELLRRIRWVVNPDL